MGLGLGLGWFSRKGSVLSSWQKVHQICHKLSLDLAREAMTPKAVLQVTRWRSASSLGLVEGGAVAMISVKGSKVE